MKLIFHPEAHEEMIESARFYEGKSEGFGSDFLTAVEEATHRIEQSPKQVPSTERKSGSGWYRLSFHNFLRKYSLVAASSQPLCINNADLVIGGTACRHRHQTLCFQQAG